MSLAHSFPYNAEVERNVFFYEINKMTATFRDNKANVSYLDDKGNLAGFFLSNKHMHVTGRGSVEIAQTKQVTPITIVIIVIITWEITLQYRIAANYIT